MTSELVQLSLCKDVDYEGLLANIALVKCLLECDENGNVALTGASADIIKALFGSVEQDGTGVRWRFNNPVGGLWYKTYQVADGVTGSTAIDGVSGASCFDNLKVNYYNKTCSTTAIDWIPSLDECLEQAFNFIKAADAFSSANAVGYIPIQFGTAPYNFLELANVFAESFMRAISDVTVQPISYSKALLVLSGFCELLKQRIELERKMKKCQLTISHCDLP